MITQQPNTNKSSREVFKQCFMDIDVDSKSDHPLETDLPNKQRIKLLTNKTNDIQMDYDQMMSKNVARTAMEVLKLCTKAGQQPDTYMPEGIKIDPTLKKAYDQVHESKRKLEKMINDKNCITTKAKGCIGYWITISPPPGHDNLTSIKQIMEHLYLTEFFKSTYSIYNIEWRDHDKETGCHVHLYIERDEDNEQDPSTQLRPLKTLQKWNIPKTRNPAIKYKYSHSPKGTNIILKYLNGEKKQSKMISVQKDKELRLKYDIPDTIEYYPDGESF